MPHNFPLSSVEERGQGVSWDSEARQRIAKVLREMLRRYRSSRMTGDILSANQCIPPGLPKWDPIGVFLTHLPLFLTAPRKNRAYWLPLPG